ncbi:hypothetical protein RQP46_004406 [Phenoliferia psychrophenolica]
MAQITFTDPLLRFAMPDTIKPLLPAGALVALTAVALISSIAPVPTPPFLRRFIRQEHLRPEEALGGPTPTLKKTPAWKPAVLSSIASCEAAGWIGYAAWTSAKTHGEIWESALMAISWTYLALVPIIKHSVTAPWPLGILYLAHTAFTFVRFLNYILATSQAPFWTIGTVLHLLALVPEAVLLATFASYPLQPYEKPVRSEDDKSERGPEDYVTVFGWASFTWAAPIVAAGRARKLEETDIYELSPTLKTEICARRFREINSLVRTLFAANALDLSLYMILSIFSAFLVYVPPFLLNRILTALTIGTPSSRRQAIVFSILALTANVIKSEVDLFSLWHSRRAAQRARGELMSEIYRKSLLRRDMSGAVADKVLEVAEKKPEGEESSGADVGKVVNLMSSDATMIANQLMMLGYLISSPFELVVAISFLYKLMGWPALAGLSVIAVAVPFNVLISKIEIKVSKRMRDAKDKRMTSVNEIIESCRTIKYFAWEDSASLSPSLWSICLYNPVQFLARVFKARDIELSWILRDRIVGMVMNLLWTIIPDAISLVSFFCYTKVAKQELSIAVAFTALALFQQIRMPLNMLPQGILGLLQRRYLIGPSEPLLPTSVSPDSAPTQRVFELKEVTVDFPIGELSLITGPTGSGKTSLLMALLGGEPPARVALARAAYSRARILVTHHVALCLPTAKYLVHLSEGAVSETIRDPSATDPKALAIVSEAVSEDVSAGDLVDGAVTPTESEATDSTAPVSPDHAPKAADDSTAKPRKLISDETRAEGNVKWRVYNTYLGEVGYLLWATIVLLIGAARLWLKKWGESYSDSLQNLFASTFLLSSTSHSSHIHHMAEGAAPTLLSQPWKLPPANENVDPYLWGYFFIGVASTVLSLLSSAFSTWGTIRAARSIFRKTLSRVVRAPSRWRLDMSVQQVILTVFGLGSALTVIFVAVPSFIFPAAVLLALYIYLYLLLRFDIMGALAVFFTTLFSLASGAGPGLAALAIVSSQSLVLNIYWLVRFVTYLEVDLNAVERIDELLHTEQEPPTIIDSNRPPAVWPSDVGGLVIEDLVIRYAPELPAVIQGLSVTFAPREKVGVVGRTGSGKSTLAMSLLRFVDPSEGKIILDGINITEIGLGDLRSKVTIIPQVRPFHNSDKIHLLIIQKKEAVLFSGTVRSNLDPFDEHSDEDLWDVLDSVRLSNGSTRPSAAPTPRRVDSLTNVAGAAATADSGANTPNAGTGRISITSLDAPVSAGGGNFSQGQRQLLALARSLLRRSKVIIMDEATASVDFQTDSIIQAAITEGFKDALVITIAHRLQTVLDYDKILVLENGRRIEFDTPKNLLLKQDSEFRKMCMKGADWPEVAKRMGVEQ